MKRNYIIIIILVILLIISLSLIKYSLNFLIVSIFVALFGYIYYEFTLTPDEKRRREEKIAERKYYDRLRREASNISYGAEIGRHRAKEQMDSEKRQPYNHNPFSQGYMGKEINKFFGKKKR